MPARLLSIVHSLLYWTVRLASDRIIKKRKVWWKNKVHKDLEALDYSICSGLLSVPTPPLTKAFPCWTSPHIVSNTTNQHCPKVNNLVSPQPWLPAPEVSHLWMASTSILEVTQARKLSHLNHCLYSHHPNLPFHFLNSSKPTHCSPPHCCHLNPGCLCLLLGRLW